MRTAKIKIVYEVYEKRSGGEFSANEYTSTEVYEEFQGSTKDAREFLHELRVDAAVIRGYHPSTDTPSELVKVYKQADTIENVVPLHDRMLDCTKCGAKDALLSAAHTCNVCKQ
jgi:hypothetical protein